jgi:hypothetical protein
LDLDLSNPESAVGNRQSADAFVGHLAARLEAVEPVRRTGRVSEVTGLVIESAGPSAVVGEVCRIHPPGGPPVRAEVVGFRGHRMLLMPLDDVGGIGPGCRVVATGQPLRVPVGPELLGRHRFGSIIGNAFDDVWFLKIAELPPKREEVFIASALPGVLWFGRRFFGLATRRNKRKNDKDSGNFSHDNVLL